MGIFSTVAGLATPWYVRYWREIGMLLVAISLGSVIAVLDHKVTVRNEELRIANDTLVRITAEYKADVQHLKAALETQNAAISIYEQKAKDAVAKVGNATTQSNVIRSNTDKQVLTILNRSKELTCEKSIESLIFGVNDLQWSKIK